MSTLVISGRPWAAGLVWRQRSHRASEARTARRFRCPFLVHSGDPAVAVIREERDPVGLADVVSQGCRKGHLTRLSGGPGNPQQVARVPVTPCLVVRRSLEAGHDIELARHLMEEHVTRFWQLSSVVGRTAWSVTELDPVLVEWTVDASMAAC